MNARIATAQAVSVVENGQPRAAIYVSDRIMSHEKPEPVNVWRKPNEEAWPARLRESVKDFASIIERISGAKLDIVVGPPADGDARLPILIGELAEARFGKVAKTDIAKQGHRIVVTDDAIGLFGESDLATSYAIYTVLYDLGCRWYIPGEMGECLPAIKSIALPIGDTSFAPKTLYRGAWYADNDYGRRNRFGGLSLTTLHALELRYLTKEDIAANPQWIATVDGKPNPKRYKWSADGLPEMLATRINEYLDDRPDFRSVSLSPNDGLGYDNSPEDRALDAGDFDPAIGDISLTDRLLWLCNRIIPLVEKEHPDVLYSTLVYANYIRPPVREKLHQKFIPQIAPITYTRAHPITDEGEPNNEAYRYLMKGWGEIAPRTAVYFYSWFLAEPSAPNPFMHKWAVNVPYVYEHANCRFWQPETTKNYETTMHAKYMAQRYAWDHDMSPQQIYDEIHHRFYGEVEQEMKAYWEYIDECWYGVPEYSGCGFGHLRRWTPDRLAKARELLDIAIAKASDETIKARVQLANESLSIFELFMSNRRDLAEGRFKGLAQRGKAYCDRVDELSKQYAENYAFGKVRNIPSLYIRYHNWFYQKTYEDAQRIATKGTLLTSTLRDWKYKADRDEVGEAEGWHAAAFDDSDWKSTDVAIDTWSAIGLHNYIGKMTYRKTVNLAALPEGERVYLWIGATNGSAKVYINGKHIPFVNRKGESVDEFTGYCQPASWDISKHVKAGDNQITIHAERVKVAELGVGGLLAPAAVYSMKSSD